MSTNIHHFHFQGHFCLPCAFVRHTRVGNYRISTVGEAEGFRFQPIGGAGTDPRGGRIYETVVFALEDDGTPWGDVANWGEIDGAAYWTREDAEEGHAAMVRKFAARSVETRLIRTSKTGPWWHVSTFEQIDGEWKETSKGAPLHFRPARAKAYAKAQGIKIGRPVHD